MTDTPNPTWKTRWRTLWARLFAKPPTPSNRVVAAGKRLLVVVDAVRRVEETAQLIASPAPRQSTIEGQSLRAVVAQHRELVFRLGYQACLRGQSEEEAWRELEQKLNPQAS